MYTVLVIRVRTISAGNSDRDFILHYQKSILIIQDLHTYIYIRVLVDT